MKTIKTKKGMASLYLVAFTTLLVGIVTVSFVEVMLNESRESSNSDLSQSALDSALAGIEDAKNAIILYNSCLNADDSYHPSGNSGPDCASIKTAMKNGVAQNDCDVIANVLGSPQPASLGATVIGDSDLDQAYTCVTIAYDSLDYRSILNSDTRSRVVPVDATDSNSADLDSEIVAVELSWYSSAAYTDYRDSDYMYESETYYTELYNNNIIPFGNKDKTSGTTGADNTVPILAFEVIQTDTSGFTMAELDLNNDTNNGTDHAMIVLYPDNNTSSRAIGDYGTFVTARNVLDASSKSSVAALTAGQDKNNSVVPKLVSCGYTDGYRCRATIELPATYARGNTSGGSYIKDTRSSNTFLFRVSLPYGGPQTDFRLKLCTDIAGEHCSTYAQFNGAQYIVDSTGRASTLYRRITARIETTSGFIYPEYAVQVSGNENSTIEKNFYVTKNCWFTDGKGNNSTCANNGDASADFPQ